MCVCASRLTAVTSPVTIMDEYLFQQYIKKTYVRKPQVNHFLIRLRVVPKQNAVLHQYSKECVLT